MKLHWMAFVLLATGCGKQINTHSETDDTRNIASTGDFAMWREGDKVFAKKCGKFLEGKPARECQDPETKAVKFETDFKSFEDSVTADLDGLGRDKKIAEWIETQNATLKRLEVRKRQDTNEFKRIAILRDFLVELKESLGVLADGKKTTTISYKADAVSTTILKGFKYSYLTTYTATIPITAKYYSSNMPENPTDYAIGSSTECEEKAVEKAEADVTRIQKKYTGYFTLYRGELKKTSNTAFNTNKNFEEYDPYDYLKLQYKVGYSQVNNGKKESVSKRSSISTNSVRNRPYVRGNAPLFFDRECADFAQTVSTGWETCEVVEID